MTRILVIGSGGREAAIVWKLAQAPDIDLFCAPGNAGIAEHATCIPIKATAVDELLAFARRESMDLTIVGPEAPLVAGIVDQFREEDLLICGPTAAAAQTEGSKVWFKQFLDRHNIPTAPFKVFNDCDTALTYIENHGAKNIVIKADGLMGGKGVKLPDDLAEAKGVLEKLMVKGSPGEMVVVEDRLVGPERSVMAITDGQRAYMFPFTQDYKRESDGNSGLNTGGMGAHTLSLPQKEEADLTLILQDVIDALAAENCIYSGFIYLGFIMTPDGPMVLECNCRLGDPETQVIIPSIDGDFATLCMAAAREDLSQVSAPVQNRHALCIVLASEAYPGTSDRDDSIYGLAEVEESGALLFHAGTKKMNGRISTNGSGRVLNIIGVGNMFTMARAIAYEGAKKVKFPGMKYRGDIGGHFTPPS